MRGLVRRLGHFFRTRNPDLPGSPDLANRSRKWAIFVHGCFWHAHRRCSTSRATPPKRNADLWAEKFARNRARDRRAVRSLRQLSFSTLVVWQCELRDESRLARRLARFLEESSHG